jgi:hypothetical protein
MKVGDPASDAAIGPVVSAAQWDKIQTLIHKGIDEGATLVAGGPGKPEGLEKGYYVRPTVLGKVNNQMTVAREEIFGPVLGSGYDTLTSGRDRQRHALRLGGLRLRHGRRDACRRVALRAGQTPAQRGARADGAVRRLQAIRQRCEWGNTRSPSF